MKRIIDISDKAYNEAITVKEISDIKDLTCGTRAEVFLAIQNSTPLEQEPRKGHWIKPRNDDGMSDSIYYQVRCSKCGFDFDPQTWHMELHQYGADNYCPNCGAKMVEPQESEDK